jgi:hypothetical protein
VLFITTSIFREGPFTSLLRTARWALNCEWAVTQPRSPNSSNLFPNSTVLQHYIWFTQEEWEGEGKRKRNFTFIEGSIYNLFLFLFSWSGIKESIYNLLSFLFSWNRIEVNNNLCLNPFKFERMVLLT